MLCAASIEEGVPRWMREQRVTGGWITAEYSMLPYATAPRKSREVTRGRVEGRTQEIQRLVGRALRSVTDIEKLGERTIWIDCDVLQADGGTRTASITGAYVAVMLAMNKLQSEGVLKECPDQIRRGGDQRRDARRRRAAGFVLRGGLEGGGGHECGDDRRRPLRRGAGHGRGRAVHAAADDGDAQAGGRGRSRN